jgi:putative FmdB family regulatory protein
MPTYSYHCKSCGAEFDAEQKISEEPIKICKVCGKPEAKRLITNGNFVLQGSGWYRDGYNSAKKV